MPRPVTLFTGQWADLPLEDLAAKAGGWGFDGLELACWGDHFEVDKALVDESYCRSQQEILERNHLNVLAIGAHLVGQASATASTRATGQSSHPRSTATASRRASARARPKG